MHLKIKRRNMIAACCLYLLSTSGTASDRPARTPADAARDVHSLPFQMLEFFGVKPGWVVVDLFGANGYYAEVLSHVVGPSGKVYLHNNQAYMGQATQMRERIKHNRLPNVEPYPREIRDIDLPSNSVDLVLMVMSYHDVYFEQNGWDARVTPTMRAVHRMLKPGGVLAVIDHHAEAGSGRAAVQVLHRIDAEFAVKDIERFGFRLEASSAQLQNPQDDLTKSVFDPVLRGKTSKFALRFTKVNQAGVKAG